jgi:CheY-like chemotaxis protein
MVVAVGGSGKCGKSLPPANRTRIVLAEFKEERPPLRVVHGRLKVLEEVTVLVAEDQPDLREALARSLRRRGFTVTTAADGNEAADKLEIEVPRLSLVEMLLPGQSGFRIAQKIKERTDGRGAVVMLAYTAGAHRDYALELGIDRFALKPFSPADLVESIIPICPPPDLAGTRGTGGRGLRARA